MCERGRQLDVPAADQLTIRACIARLHAAEPGHIDLAVLLADARTLITALDPIIQIQRDFQFDFSASIQADDAYFQPEPFTLSTTSHEKTVSSYTVEKFPDQDKKRHLFLEFRKISGGNDEDDRFAPGTVIEYNQRTLEPVRIYHQTKRVGRRIGFIGFIDVHKQIVW